MKLNSVSYSPITESGTAYFYDGENGSTISIRFSPEQCAQIDALIRSFLPAVCERAIEVLGDAKTDMLSLEGPANGL